MLISVAGTCNTQLEPGQYDGCSSAYTSFSAKISLTKTDRCAGALSCRWNQLLLLHFSRHFLLTASLRRRRLCTYISIFTVSIPVNYKANSGKFWSYYVHASQADRYILSACWFRCSVTSHRAFLKTYKRSGKYLLGIYQHETLHFARRLLP
jgi:hypothetical protein